MIGRFKKYFILFLLFAIFLIACSSTRVMEEEQTIESKPTQSSPTLKLPTSTIKPTSQPSAIPATATDIIKSNQSPIGIGLRSETVDILLRYQDCQGLTMASSSEMAETYFPKLTGWLRIIGAPSLSQLEKKGNRAQISGIPYEGLGYGLETSKSTPDTEWKDPINSTRKARELTASFNKLLVMGPGFQLMSKNESNYPPMASLSDMWLLQTQQLQKNPPGASYREEVIRLVDLIRSENPGIKIWAQITLPPDRDPDAAEWLAYRQSIIDVVDGTYIGVYTWDRINNQILQETVMTIFNSVCDESINK